MEKAAERALHNVSAAKRGEGNQNQRTLPSEGSRFAALGVRAFSLEGGGKASR